MGQEKLNDIAMLSIEAEIAGCVDLQDVGNDFAEKKTRKAFCQLNWHIGLLSVLLRNNLALRLGACWSTRRAPCVCSAGVLRPVSTSSVQQKLRLVGRPRRVVFSSIMKIQCRILGS